MDGITWWRRPGERVHHAFSDGPGWRRSACRRLHYSVLLIPHRDPHMRCMACMVAIRMGQRPDSAIGEAEARAAFGDR